MALIPFEENVRFTDAISLALPGRCSFNTFPGGVLSIILFLIIIVVIISVSSSILSGNVIDAIWIVIGSTILSLFTVYINAYLRKGCEAAKLIKENNDNFMISLNK
jgi:hypothetical protein